MTIEPFQRWIDGWDGQLAFDLEMIVGLPGEATVTVTRGGCQSAMDIGAEIDEPTWVTTAHAGQVSAGTDLVFGYYGGL